MPVVSLVPYSFGAHHVRCAEFDDVAQRFRCRTVIGRSSATKFGSPWTGVDSFYIQCRSGVDDGVLAGITRNLPDDGAHRPEEFAPQIAGEEHHKSITEA